jgi:opacity protein-like surface antigen
MKKLSAWCVRGLTTTLLLAATGAASAADLGFYVVVDGTSNKAHIPASYFQSQIAIFLDQPVESVATTRVDVRAKRYSMTVGYQLGTYFAVEGTYYDFGKYAYDYIAYDDGGGEHFGRLSIKPRGPSVSAVGLLPLGDYFSLDGHAGFLFIDNKYKISLDEDRVGFSLSKTGLYYGAGLAWWVTGQVALRVGYNRFERGVFEQETSQYTVGIRYSYGY